MGPFPTTGVTGLSCGQIEAASPQAKVDAHPPSEQDRLQKGGASHSFRKQGLHYRIDHPIRKAQLTPQRPSTRLQSGFCKGRLPVRLPVCTGGGHVCMHRKYTSVSWKGMCVCRAQGRGVGQTPKPTKVIIKFYLRKTMKCLQGNQNDCQAIRATSAPAPA